MSGKGKKRVVYQERLAKRQAVERLRRAYVKLYRQAPTEIRSSVPKPEKNKSIQEKK